ncbi:hypothetical protein RQP46_007104 [Phenoliferia psychrophenolica]
MSYAVAASEATLQSRILATVATLELPSTLRVTSTTWARHSSLHANSHARFEIPAGDIDDYERLEHLGDADLTRFVTHLIHSKYPALVVGARTAIRAACVQNSTLAVISKALGLPDLLEAHHTQLDNMRHNEKTQADLFEAYIAAATLERGASEVDEFLEKIFSPLVDSAYRKLREDHEEGLAPVATPVAVVARVPTPAPALARAVVVRGDTGSTVRRTSFNAQRDYISPITISGRGGVARQLAWTDFQTGASHIPHFYVTLTVTLPRGGGEFTFTGEGTTKKGAKNFTAYQACVQFGLA